MYWCFSWDSSACWRKTNYLFCWFLRSNPGTLWSPTCWTHAWIWGRCYGVGKKAESRAAPAFTAGGLCFYNLSSQQVRMFMEVILFHIFLLCRFNRKSIDQLIWICSDFSDSAAEAVMKGQSDSILRFHQQNVPNSKLEQVRHPT